MKHRIFIAILSFISFVYLYPLIITFTNSLMKESEIKRNYSTEKNLLSEKNFEYAKMNLIPERISFEQYTKILFKTPAYLKMILNSIKITLPVIFGQIIISLILSYIFIFFDFKFKQKIFFIFISVIFLPLQVTMVPNYIVSNILGLKNSYLSIILPAIFNPFGLFLIYQTMKLIPKSYIESAKIDGASHIKIFFNIVIPMQISSIISLAILTFIDYWNVVDQAIIFLDDAYKYPLSLFLSKISEEEMGIIFSSSYFYAIPILIILFFGQKNLKKGIEMSGFNG